MQELPDALDQHGGLAAASGRDHLDGAVGRLSGASLLGIERRRPFALPRFR
jgi:hypothetical protein